MNTLRLSALFVSALFTLSLQAAENQAMHCQRADAVRVIEVVYPQGTELPCEVHYTKDGQTSVLWRAGNEAGYCEQKAADFTQRQRDWGWQCVATAATTTPKDDTP